MAPRVAPLPPRIEDTPLKESLEETLPRCAGGIDEAVVLGFGRVKLKDSSVEDEDKIEERRPCTSLLCLITGASRGGLDELAGRLCESLARSHLNVCDKMCKA